MKQSKAFFQKLTGKLKEQEKSLLEQKKALEEQDSFKDVTRTLENSDDDLEVDEQNMHEKVQTLKSAVDRNLRQVERALEALKKGRYGKCDICGLNIDQKRLKVFPTATLCTKCREKREQQKERVYKKRDLLTSR